MEGAALAARRRLERDRATVRFLLRDEPERRRELQRTPRPEPGVLEPLGDGYLLRRPDGSEVVLLGEAFKWASAADALAVSPSLPNQVQIFEGYEGLMGRDWASTFVPPGATLTLAERREVNQRASQAILDLYHPIEVEPIPRRIDCGQEQGVGTTPRCPGASLPARVAATSSSRTRGGPPGATRATPT